MTTDGPDSSPHRAGSRPPAAVQASGRRWLAEFLYDLAALTAVGAFAYFFFWAFVVLVGPALLISLVLMAVEHAVR